jgi:phage-related protein
LSFTSEYFQIDGIKSTDIGVNGCYLVRVGNTEINRQIIGNKSLNEEKIPHNDLSYLYNISKEPIEFDLQFSLLEDEYTPDRLIELGKIFAGDKYVPFISVDYPQVQFFVICTSMNLITFGLKRGYFECRLRTSAPFAFAFTEVSTFDFSTITSPTTFILTNKSNVSDAKGNYYYMPETIYIDLKSTSTGVTITNLSDNARQFIFTGLSTSECLVIDNKMGRITSSTTLARLSCFNKNWLRLVYGVNQLTCSSKCVLQFHCQYPVYV